MSEFQTLCQTFSRKLQFRCLVQSFAIGLEMKKNKIKGEWMHYGMNWTSTIALCIVQIIIIRIMLHYQQSIN